MVESILYLFNTTGLIFGLQQALDMNIKTLTVKGDSQLVINQMTGKYKCNSDNIIELYKKAKELEKEFEKIYFVHVLRNNLEKKLNGLPMNAEYNGHSEAPLYLDQNQYSF
jgi:ribonuclease HI